MRKFLYCPICEDESSCTRGDYWKSDPDYVFECALCGINLALVQEVVTLDILSEEVRLADLTD